MRHRCFCSSFFHDSLLTTFTLVRSYFPHRSRSPSAVLRRRQTLVDPGISRTLTGQSSPSLCPVHILSLNDEEWQSRS